MADEQKVSYSATLDISKAVKSAKELEKTLQSVAKVIGGGTGGGAAQQSSSLKKQVQEQLKANQTVSAALKQNDDYRRQISQRAERDQNLSLRNSIQQKKQALAEQTKLVKKAAQEEVQQAQFVAKTRKTLLGQSGQLTQHSNRQFGQLAGIGLQLAGQGIMQAGAYGRQLYGSGISSYQNLNNQYSINPNLTAANRNLTRSQLSLGNQLSGYQAFKTNAQAAINSSPFAAPLAIGGDVLGAAAPAVGGITQMLGALKTVNPKAAESVGEMLLKVGGIAGKGGVLGAAAVAGGVVGINVGNALNKAINPNAKEQDWGDVLTTVKKTIALDVGAATGMNKQVVGGVGSILGATPNNHSDVGSVWADIWGDGKGADAIRQSNAKKDSTKAAAEAVAKQATSANEFKKVIASPQFQIQAAGIRNQISDFNYDSARQERLARRDFSRQKADIGTSRTRAKEDRAFQVEGFSIQSGRTDEDYARNRKRTEEDYARTVQKNELQISRVRRDALTTATRQNQDFARSRVRFEQDTARQTVRLEQDTSRDTTRLAQDTSRSSLRLTEDTNREKTRSDEDYARSKAVMARDNARSEQDLSRNYQQSLLSIVAPGLTSSKGYQIAKLQSDFKRESTRMREDQAQAGQDLERGRSRNLEDIGREQQRGSEDIARGQQRGSEDIGRSYTRGQEDIARGSQRFGEDTNREQSRASQDLAKQTTDALTDSFISAKEAEIEHTRAIQDQDREYARAKQDLQREETQAAREYTRTVEDLDKATKRLTEDFTETLTDIQHARETFARDTNLQLTQMGIDLADKTGSNKNYTADEVSNAAGLGKVNSANPNSTDNGGDYASGLAKHLLGQFATGTDYVQQTGPYVLHRGEAVITAAQNQAGANQAVAGGANAAQLNPNSPWQTFMRQMAGGTFGQSAGGASSNSGFDLGAIQNSAASSAAGMLGGLAGGGDTNGAVHDQAWYTAQSSAAWQKHNADLVANIQSQAPGSEATAGWRNQMLAQFQMYNNGGGGLAGMASGASGGAFSNPYTSGSLGGSGLSNGSLEGSGPNWMDSLPSVIQLKRQGYHPPMRGGGGGGLNYNPTYNINGGGSMHPQIRQEIDRHKTALNGIMGGLTGSVY